MVTCPTWAGPELIAALRSETDKPFDAHLQVAEPERFIELFARAGCETLIVHLSLPITTGGSWPRSARPGASRDRAQPGHTPRGARLPHRGRGAGHRAHGGRGLRWPAVHAECAAQDGRDPRSDRSHGVSRPDHRRRGMLNSPCTIDALVATAARGSWCAPAPPACSRSRTSAPPSARRAPRPSRPSRPGKAGARWRRDGHGSAWSVAPTPTSSLRCPACRARGSVSPVPRSHRVRRQAQPVRDGGSAGRGRGGGHPPGVATCSAKRTSGIMRTRAWTPPSWCSMTSGRRARP